MSPKGQVSDQGITGGLALRARGFGALLVVLTARRLGAVRRRLGCEAESGVIVFLLGVASFIMISTGTAVGYRVLKFLSIGLITQAMSFDRR